MENGPKGPYRKEICLEFCYKCLSEGAEYFNKGAQPQIQQAAWTARNIFNVGVHYMGADESAVADEVCKVLASHGVAANTRVRVIDINSMGSDPKRWDVVGQASCR